MLGILFPGFYIYFFPTAGKEIIENMDLIKRFLYFGYTFPMIFSVNRIFFLLCVFTYDTPKYYVMKKDEAKAIEILNYIYKEEYVNS